jgi:hypothetical protein
MITIESNKLYLVTGGSGFLGHPLVKYILENNGLVRVISRDEGKLIELKEKFPNLKVIAVEPELSPVLSGGNPGPHPLQGIGAGFVPKNYHTNAID